MIKPICMDRNILSAKAIPASRKDIRLARDLKDTLAARDDLAGIAADMIGSDRRIIAVRFYGLPLVMFNPVITRRGEPYQAMEGCACHVGRRPAVRYQAIRVEYRDEKWRPQVMDAMDLTAQAIQHELDHLEGILI